MKIRHFPSLTHNSEADTRQTDSSAIIQMCRAGQCKGFFPYYQPIIGLTSGKIEGYEALARYRDAKGRILSAGSLFLDPDIDSEMKLSIDRQVRQQALKDFACYEDSGYININISPGWIDRLDDLNQLPTLKMVKDAGISPSRIIIEITETSGDLTRLRDVVCAYHDAGMLVAIDDFGAGASQIDRIEALEPDIVKLDMRMFKRSLNSSISADIALAITNIASRVGCHIVCEGVETEDEFYFGIECGCSHIQGFLFMEAQSAPVDTYRFSDRIRSLQASYLHLKSGKLQETAKQKESLKKLVMDIKDHVISGNLDVPIPELRASGIIRYYICDQSGNQLTPNYEIGRDRVFSDNNCQGMNWSHRPYFPLFIALSIRLEHNFFASDVYRDAITHQLCKTYGTCLDDKRVLLVDAEVPDEIIYSRQPLQINLSKD